MHVAASNGTDVHKLAIADRPIMRGVAAGRSDRRERLAAGGRRPPDPCEARQPSMLGWPWRHMCRQAAPRMRGADLKQSKPCAVFHKPD